MLYRADNLAENVEVPEFYVECIGEVTNCDPNVRVVFARPGFIGSTRMIIPRVAIIRPLATLGDAWAVMSSLREAKGVGGWTFPGWQTGSGH